MAQALYRGFSSHEYGRNKSFRVNDVELVKIDILNHLMTRKGERVKMPRFGTRIPDLVFEPLTKNLVEVVREDIEAVVAYDPRVKMVDLDVVPNYDSNAISAALTIRYVELGTVDSIPIHLEFNQA